MDGNRSDAGISNLGMILSMAGFLVVLLIVAIVVSVTLPTSTTTSDTVASTTTSSPHGSPAQATTTTTAAGLAGTPSAADVAACKADISSVQAALGAYQATNGSYPTPPAPWTAADYPTDFSPLTNAPPPGPFLKMPPGDNHYVILWDSSGHIWVESPGTFTPAYDDANDGANPATCSRVAR